MNKYNHQEIEGKWQKIWQESGLYKTGEDASKPKYYILDMFPYPSGAGLHVGHPKGYIATDVLARMRMMQGYNVLHPMGWDAFGLPAENYAIKNKVHPRIATEKNVATFKGQLAKLGLSYDWEREINTTDPEFYKWTQWIFLKMFEKGLAFESYDPINWCPSCKTGLANEDLENGRCERCDSQIERKPMRQWTLRITDYADRLLNDLEKLPDWEDAIKEMQRNWIGRSEGVELDFALNIGEKYQKIYLASGNLAKLERLRKIFALVDKNISIELVPDLIEVEEKDSEVLANAAKKVEVYAGKYDFPVLAGDTAVFFDGQEFDPTHVKRACLNGRNEKDFTQAELAEMIVDFYKNIAKEAGGKKDFYYEDGWALLLPDKTIRQAKYRREYILTDQEKREKRDDFFPMRSLYVSKITGKYTVEHSEEEYAQEFKPQIEAMKSVLMEKIKVFTTRPDTLFGCTYMVLAPEHPLVEKMAGKISNIDEVRQYADKARNKSSLERTDLNKEKTGLKLEGVMAVNPVNGEEVPVFVADYVMLDYGTGAIMAVPAHDERDWEFAQKYNLNVVQVVRKNNIIPRSYLMGGENISDQELSDLGAKILEKNAEGDRSLEISAGKLDAYKQLIKEKLTPGFWNEIVEEEILFIFKNNNGEVREIVLNKETALEIEKLGAEYNNEAPTNQPYAVWKWLADNKTYTDLIIHSEEGASVNSGFLDGLSTVEAKKKMATWLEENGLGKKTVKYKLRDWVFSRQRYWGEPIPVVHCESCGVVAVPEDQLPITLPEVEHYEPTGTGESPLAGIEDWVKTTCPKCGGPARRETNTMPQWAGSSWYYLRFIDPANKTALVDKNKDKYWSPVDFYVGGAEHATRHLIYARFWHKFLYDIGAVAYDEPFKRLQHVGLILAEDGRKMSKRWGNVINPDEIVDKYGADAMRVYEMFMGPFSQACAWNTNSLTGARKFLDRIYQMRERVVGEAVMEGRVSTVLHQTIKKVGADIEDFKFNTAIAQMMILVNELSTASQISLNVYENLLKILSPIAPYLSEELWQSLTEIKADPRYAQSIIKQSWPKFDPDLIIENTVKIAIQINGKLREVIEMPAGVDENEACDLAAGNEKIKAWLAKFKLVRVVFVKDKLLNFIVE